MQIIIQKLHKDDADMKIEDNECTLNVRGRGITGEKRRGRGEREELILQKFRWAQCPRCSGVFC